MLEIKTEHTQPGIWQNYAKSFLPAFYVDPFSFKQNFKYIHINLNIPYNSNEEENNLDPADIIEQYFQKYLRFHFKDVAEGRYGVSRASSTDFQHMIDMI